MQNFQNLEIWQKAHRLSVSVYKLTSTFPNEEKFALTSQLKRSASSIAANIAEGCGRKTQNDFANFLHIALGSANETSYFLLLANEVGLLSDEHYEIYKNEIENIKAKLINLISKVKS